MNRRKISPIHLALISLMAILPAVTVAPVHAQSPTLAVDPQFSAGDVGDTLTVSVMGSDIPDLVAYDVTLRYSNIALSNIAVDFDASTVATNCAHFNVVQQGPPASDLTGTVRYATAFLGGCSYDVSSPEPLMIMSFQVIAAEDSELTIIDDEIVALVGGVPTTVDHDTVSGGFLVPPSILYHLGGDPTGDIDARTVDPSNRQRFLSRGETFVTLNGYIQLSPMAVRGSFGAVHFTVDGPGGTFEGDSEIAFMFPGQSATVQGTVDYSSNAVAGTYTVKVTILRCPAPSLDSCVEGASTEGKFFKVHD